MTILKAGLLYFAIVFGAGFVLGTIRTLWLVPRLGTRVAELLESPIMLVATIFTATWVVDRLVAPVSFSTRLGIGCLASVLLVVAELALLQFRGLSIKEYFATRERISGAVYYVLLGVFAVMPLIVARE